MIALLIIIVALLPRLASAHEAYVLPSTFFWEEVIKPINWQVFNALGNLHDLAITLKITGAVLLVILFNFALRQTSIGEKIHAWPEKFAHWGPIFVRITIAIAFFMGARSNAFLGPELPIDQMPWANVMQVGLYLTSIMIFFGLFTEVAGLIGLTIFTIGFFAFGTYLVTYLNYLGELIVLAIFGMRRFSLDRLFFGPLKQWRYLWERYETTIVRIFYGVALVYAGVAIKFLHPELTLTVINDWNLTQFHWLFPSNPLLVVFGAGLAEAAIGLFIIFGFEMRMAVLISLFYLTLSLGYFRELVWPHILLYGISFNLLVQPEILTLDHFFFEHHRRAKSIWQRLISSHRQ